MYAWEQQEKESNEAHAAFLCYRDMPKAERSCVKVSQEFAKCTRLIQRWHKQWQWQIRAAAWDEEQLRVGDEATLAAIRETNKAIHEACATVRQKAVDALKNKNYEEMGVQELLLVFDTVNKHDRAALGVDAGGGRNGPGSKGGGAPPQFFKVYEGVDVSRI